MTTTRLTPLATALTLGASALLLAGCAGTPNAAPPADTSTDMPEDMPMDMPMQTAPGAVTHGSRHTLYHSLAELAGDSSEIVAGTVTAQREVSDLAPGSTYTISTVRVASAVKADGGIAPGVSVEVRQIGTRELSGPAPLLTQGSGYLLYLTHSGLRGDAAAQYYVTGGVAGIYAVPAGAAATTQDADDAAAVPSFTRLGHGEGDELPEGVAVDQARG